MNSNPDSPHILHTGDYLQTCRNGTWEFVRRVNTSGGAAFMVATTDADELVLVEQYRVPVARRVIELPAGIIGDDQDGEAPESAAIRELEEETGYRPGKVRLLHQGPTAAGLTSEWAFYFRMTALERVHAGGGTADEDITTHRVPLAAVPTWLAEQEVAGKCVDARIYAALQWLRQE